MMRYSSTPTVGSAGGVLFGASYYSVLVSFDQGRTWRQAYKLLRDPARFELPIS